MDILTLIESAGFNPRRISAAEGGEYASGCPFCGDGGKGGKSDRFHAWPEAELSKYIKGRYWCRKCDKHGDTINLAMETRHLDFAEACTELGVVLPTKEFFKKSWPRTPATPNKEKNWIANNYALPCERWQGVAAAFVADCRERLFASADALAWLARRGITAEIARAYGLGYNQSSRGGDRYRPRERWALPPKKSQDGKDKKLWLPQGWTIPAKDKQGRLYQVRIRRRNEDIEKFAADIKYLPIDGSSMATMVLHPRASVFAVVECGFDAILIAGLFCGEIGTITTWNSSARPDAETDAILQSCVLILNCLDYDDAGEGASEWWHERYPHCVRPKSLGKGLKDPGDMAAAGINVRSWLLEALPRGLQITMGCGSVGDRPPASQPSAPVAKEGSSEPAAKVIELDLLDGERIYITDDQREWHRLMAAGKLAFSGSELERIEKGIGGLGAEERIAALAVIIAAKKEFGGYVRAGRHDA